MDGFDQRVAGASENERERRDRVLLNMLAGCTPREFWIGLRSGARRVYKETLERNQSDPDLLQQSIRFKTISDRHFYTDKLLYNLGVEAGFVCEPALIKINKWRYTQIQFGSFTSIQKYCRKKSQLPKPADFRKKLAKSGGISIQDDLLRPSPVLPDGKRVLNGILIHGPQSRNPRHIEFGEVGFVCYAIPYDDYSDWAAVLDIDKIVDAYESRLISEAKEAESTGNGFGLTWKARPDEVE